MSQSISDYVTNALRDATILTRTCEKRYLILLDIDIIHDHIHSRSYNNKTVLWCDTVHQTSRREQWPPDWPSAPAADSPTDVWWTVSRYYTVLFLSRDVKNTKFNQYLPVLLTSLNVPYSRFRKFVMFWMWRHHDMTLWRHSCGAWHNGLILTTAGNANSWADVANHVTRLWQAGDTENFERRITG